MVVVVITILAATSIPRMSRGSGDANDLPVSSGLAALRNAIDLYCAEHGGAFPAAAGIHDQLTQYTDLSGAVSTTKTVTHVCGPYLRSIPPLPVGVRKGMSGIGAGDANDVGWLYTEASGKITANTTTEVDDARKPYKDY